MDRPIYLDYNATTPLSREVAVVMSEFLAPNSTLFGNPSSTHFYGIHTKKLVEKSRQQVASLLDCNEDEIIFTSGGSESNNYAIKGAALAMREKSGGSHIITSMVEHPAVIETCKYLEEKERFSVTYLGVDHEGLISLSELEKSIRPDETILVTVMHANNETGVVQPLKKISEVVKKFGIVFHTDASQSVGKISSRVDDLGVDLLTVCPHKFYGPKGIGALYIRRGIQLRKMVHGGGHERDMRAGTENIMLITGLGTACEIAKKNLDTFNSHMKTTRDHLYEGLVSLLGEKRVKLNGPSLQKNESRLPNTLNVSFPHVHANMLLSKIGENVAASAGAACHSGSTEDVTISHVLKAMKVPVEIAQGTIRFSTGRETTTEEIDKAVKFIVEAVNQLNPISSAEKEESCDIIENVKLTSTTHGLGCGCKMRPQILEKVLKGLPKLTDPNVLVGTETSDDAGVYQISENLALVQTVDFFTPIVDDPYEYGVIAASNALSDVYAMGGVPITALNIVGFPTGVVPLNVLNRILLGASDKATEAGVSILGGHTIDDTELKFGMSVTGKVDPSCIWKNSTAQVGDLLILTKPIGVGVAATAMKRGLSSNSLARESVRVMSLLNKYPADILREIKGAVSACTDVTGFGLLGHLKEMVVSSGVDAFINFKNVPLLPGVWEHVVADTVPGGTKNNHSWVASNVIYENGVTLPMQLILCDSQTSGGLLFSIKSEFKDEVIEKLEKLKQKGEIGCCAVIGEISAKGKGIITVKT